MYDICFCLSDKVTVSVSFEAITNRCYGFVYVEMNDQKRAVCSNKWGRAESEVVCGELNCGHVVSHEQRPLQGKGIMDQVSCLGNETSIWHCRAMRSLSIACHNKVFVVCSESVDVRLKDGLGKFNGRLEILHGNMWMPVSKEQWEDVNLDVVCKQVGRRNSRRALEKYSTDSKNFPYRLQCNKNAVHISECITENATTSLLDAKPLEITCKEHKLLILKGDDPCSGLVVIEKKDQTYWLSGSNATWNQESANVVCQEKHCGNASSFYASFLNITNQTSVWDQSYNCSPGAKSLFDCETHLEQPSDHNSSIAAVKCSEKITISLQHQCWGEVSICMDGKCGSVCQESLSQVYPDLCKSLQCGEKVVKTSKILPKTNTTIKRLHQTRHTTNLTQSIFVMSEEHDICTPAYVVCSGSLKPKLSGVDRCSGNLEVFQEDTWLSVCKQDHSKNVHNAICQELQCGEEVEITQDTGPAPANTRFSNLKCNRNSQSLSECEVSTANKACKAAVLKCTGWRKMRTLNTCSGPVLVYSKGQRSAVAVEGWTEKEGERLCLDLQCGGFKSLKGHNTTEKLLFWNGSFRCENNETNIWACEKPTPPSEKQQLFIQCQDTPKVSLSENCHGLVKIDGIEVCNSFWNMEMSHMVCQEQNCSNAITPTKTIGAKSNADYYHSYHFHHELGQCWRVTGMCGPGKELVSVNCIGSVWFSTDQRCGGQLKISYGDKLERVCPMDFSSKTSEDLCRALDCNGHNQTLRTRESTEKVNLEMSFKCEQNHKDIRYCVTSKSCTGVRPAEIYCNGYEYLQPASSPPSTAGHYEWLGLPILIVALIISICIVKKFKKTSLSKKEKVLSRKAAEIESGDYEEVHSDANEMEELDKRTSRSPTESLTAEQARGSPSLTNGKEAKAQPLNSEHLEGTR
ncbi:scavenger receptor cysteine-rich type 1 protein M160-like [Cynoglossus semilaevis]|uniref:scavenger receptor cysteine-rich type 1 protein M160-like n=1 Tax=Cynoglossus semilaevis TaxID=244447 RepID=UPI000D6282FB|nr:scavenger receptor cysteine-rich type 1 protein M160-like [Cynoglossus semilaevis]